MRRKKEVFDSPSVFDFRMLRVRLYQLKIFKGFEKTDVADELGITATALEYKLCNSTPFTVAEIAKLIQILNLSPDEVGPLFFTPAVKE